MIGGYAELETRIHALIASNPFYRSDDIVLVQPDFHSDTLRDLSITYLVKRMSLIGPINDKNIDAQGIPDDFARDNCTGFTFNYKLSEMRGEIEMGLANALEVVATPEMKMLKGTGQHHRIVGEVEGWLHVIPEYRNRNVGRELAKLVFEIGRMTGLEFIYYEPELTDSRIFLRKIGFSPFEGDYQYKLL